ncbi:type II toxin-antitoxin system VapC family toxin [Agriterribacter sp.]|uniref:type II toxin-antitoxin system VapC family toxin n=1 Tax=Agriterribacter sp. TaxID=2821509 RepID=UPI002C085C98|nr:type II toxin-antitoxin system VapC family toxin [Agriterribacter sp.]HRP58023.1 type II toxin-antitoxin system VapC family toxin [Agriterribacter sp.]
MKPGLLDTDILSEFLRGTPKVVENVEVYLRSYDAINFSIIGYYEILNGLLYKDARRQLKRFTEFAELSKILLLTISATRRAAEIYADLKRKGQPIGHTDCLIAGVALTNDVQLVTNNTDHFKRVKGLEIVNWLR